MRSTRFLLPMLLTCCAVAPLAGQDVRFGFQGGLAVPAGDLSDSADLGLQAGVHAKWDLGSGHGLMARADLTSYSRKDGYGSASFAVGADYTFHFNRDQRGPYLLAGLSVQNYSREVPDGTEHDNGLGLDVGVGYDLDRHFGLQARITTLSASHADLNALILGFTYSF